MRRDDISRGRRCIYDSGERHREATIRNFRTVQTEGSRQVARNVDFYNLDAIISVGYRVNSVRATQFRQWAHERRDVRHETQTRTLSQITAYIPS